MATVADTAQQEEVDEQEMEEGEGALLGEPWYELGFVGAYPTKYIGFGYMDNYSGQPCFFRCPSFVLRSKK